jgi:hypothetical protein
MFHLPARLVPLCIGIAASFAWTSAATAQLPPTKTVDGLGNYRLGDSVEKFRAMPGFEDDASRTVAAEGIKAGKIIGSFDGHIAIQRLYFKAGKLVRFSILFGEASMDEAKVKSLVAAEWGDPGPRMKLEKGPPAYVWTGTHGIAMVLPADRGLWMASIGLRE